MKNLKQLQNVLLGTFLIFLCSACGGDEEPTNVPGKNNSGNNTSFNSIEEAREAGQEAMTHTFASLESFAGDAFYDLSNFSRVLSQRLRTKISSNGRLNSDKPIDRMLFEKMLEHGKNFVEHEEYQVSEDYGAAFITFDISPGTYTIDSKKPERSFGRALFGMPVLFQTIADMAKGQ